MVRGQLSTGNSPRGQLSGGQSSSGAIIRRAIFFEGNCPRTAREICEHFVFRHSETVEYVKNLPTF